MVNFYTITHLLQRSTRDAIHWAEVDKLITNSDPAAKLAELGIAEGDGDDDSAEGQIWMMVEGKAPYTLDMV